MPNIPPNLPDVAATAIVRKAEEMKKMEQAEKQRMADEKRRREQAMRDAEAAKRNQGTNQR
jgi:hypothetical protein